MPVGELISFVTTISGLLVILSIVATKNYKSPINSAFLLFGILVLLYVTASFVSNFFNNLYTVLLWSRTDLMIANFIPIGFYRFTLAFTNIQPKHKWQFVNYFVYGGAFALAPVAYLHAGIYAVSKSSTGTVLSGTGPALWLTVAYLLLAFGISFVIFYLHSRRSDPAVRFQVKIISYSLGFVVAINLITQIVLPEFKVLNLGNLIGNPALLILVGGIGYAIVRKKLFDIRSTVVRSFGFVTTLGAIVVIYSILMVGASKLFFPSLNLTLLQKGYFVTAAIILTYTFRPLLKGIEKVTDKLFFRTQYDPEALIRDIGRILASEIKLDELSRQVVASLKQYLRVKVIDIVVLDKGKVYYEAGDYFKKDWQSFVEDMNKLGDQTLVADELPENEQRSILRAYGISVFVVLKTNIVEKVGYLLLSEKHSGTLFNSTDVRTMEIVKDSLTVAIQNTRSYAQIEQFNLTLQAKVEEATKKLTETNQELKKVDATKDDFISMASHQLTTPLAVMDGYLSLISKGMYGDTSPKAKHAIDVALSRTRMMKGLVFDLLNISRMTGGKFFMELASADMNELVTEQVSLLATAAEEKKVQLTYHPPDNPLPAINVDIQKTQQAVMNLINNAIFYAKNGTVDVYLGSHDGSIVFKVVDNGIGVPDGEKTKLFTKFFRADNAKKESPNGTGIGLYLVRRVVEEQHGRIIFSSKLGHGSTFGFTLPIHPVASTGTPTPARSEEKELVSVN